MEILEASAQYLICIKEPGVECEAQLPQLLAQAVGGSPGDYFCVHRLDRAVGGVMVYARTKKAAASLSAQIQSHTFQKEYLAVCAGVPCPEAGTMTDYLYKDPRQGRAFPVKRLRKGVKEARLAYTTLARAQWEGRPFSLVQVRLETGRFHQIRCQFASRKMPLAGDGKYGSRLKGCGVSLYSYRLAFRHPVTGQPVEYKAPFPVGFPWDLFPDEV